jgi:hypothetical protein
VKVIAPEVLNTVVDRHGYAELSWTKSVPIAGDPDFPVLELPAEKLRYATARAFPIKLAARKMANGSALLFVQFESFDIAAHAASSPEWAVPGKYTPSTEDESVDQALGFDEGWADAEPECIFICDERFAVFWRAAHERRRFGLTAPEQPSLYPVALDKPALAALKDALKAWRSTSS